VNLRRAINRGGAVFFALLIPGYVGWVIWDMSEVRSFCAEVHAGLTLDDLPEMARRHWIDPRWVRKAGYFDESTKTWNIKVPASSTMGDLICLVQYKQKTVVSARAVGP
jgi:hypothetical protein